jgi:hypothetical protein
LHYNRAEAAAQAVATAENGESTILNGSSTNGSTAEPRIASVPEDESVETVTEAVTEINIAPAVTAPAVTTPAVTEKAVTDKAVTAETAVAPEAVPEVASGA